MGEQAQAVRAAIQEAVFEALRHAPSLIILDDLDLVIPSNLSSENSEPSTSSVVLSEYLSDLLDMFRVLSPLTSVDLISGVTSQRAYHHLKLSLNVTAQQGGQMCGIPCTCTCSFQPSSYFVLIRCYGLCIHQIAIKIF